MTGEAGEVRTIALWWSWAWPAAASPRSPPRSRGSCGREFRDGDSFHSPDNVAKMARGEALTDDDRLPWLDSIAAWLAASPGRIVACSALRKSYRDRLRVAGPLLFLYLDITPSTATPAGGRTPRALHARLAHRRSIRHVGKANAR